MRDLKELQHHFQNYLLDKTNCVAAAVVDVQPMSAKARLAIYREGYYLRLLEALEQDYEVLRALVGEEEFDQLGRDYIHEYPSHFRSIRWYGKELADFLQKKKLTLNQLWLTEMAQFEWLLTEAFDAAASTVVTVEEMAAIPFKKWPKMRFILHPSLRQLILYTNVVPIWQSYKEDGVCLPLQKSEIAAPWIIWRKELEVQFCSLAADETYMLRALMAGAPFGTLCEGLSEWVEEQNVAMHAALLLKRFILDHLIAEVIV